MTEANITVSEEKKEVSQEENTKDNNQKIEKRDNLESKRRRVRLNRGRRDNKKEPKEFEESIIQIARVTRVVKGGRRMRFRISVIVGDKKGRVGFGIGKSAEVLGGIQKAVFAAKKNLKNVSIDKETDSIPHPVKGEFKSSQVLLFPAPEGKGIVAGGSVRKILELAGFRNVLSKIHGSRNSLNTTMATLDALSRLANFPNPGKKVKKVEAKEGDKSEKKLANKKEEKK